MKIEAIQTQQAAAQAQAQAEADAHSQVKTPSTQDKKQDLNTGKHKQVLPKPDIEDLSLEHARRVVITI